MKTLSDIAAVQAGQAAPKDFDSEGVPFIRAGHLQELLNGMPLSSLPKVNEQVAKDKKLKLLVKGSILFAKSGMSATKNRVYTTDAPAYFVSHLAAITPYNDVDGGYLAYFLNWFKPSTLIIDEAYPSIRLSEIGNLKIPLPPLKEQKKIAEILDAANSVKQKDQQLVEHYDRLSQSLFLDMFGDPVANPKGWQKSIADSHIDLISGFAFKSKDYSNNKDDIHLCGGLIISPTEIEWEKANYWSRDKVSGLEKYWLKEGDIVMAMDRPWISSGFKIHKMTKHDKKSLLVQRTARIRGKNINQDFLYFIFNQKAFEKHAVTTETTVPHISPNDIRSYQIIIPPIALQNEFSGRLYEIKKQKELAQQSLKKSNDLFDILLQRAFKGELTAS